MSAMLPQSAVDLTSARDARARPAGQSGSLPREDLDKVFSYHLWRHRIPLAAGVETPGRVFASEWEEAFLPDRLDGLSFLDVGANDGLFAFQAEQRGARSVVATDIYAADGDGRMTAGWNDTGTMIAHDILRSNVLFQRCSVYDLHTVEPRFDYVLCSHVLAWLRDPLAAIEQLASRCAGTLHIREDIATIGGATPTLELIVTAGDVGTPYLYNPNKAWLTTVLGGLGFKDIQFRPIDEQAILRHRDKQFPLYSISANTDVYRSPFQESVVGTVKTTRQLRSEYRHEDFLYFPALGWIRNGDGVVRLAERPSSLGLVDRAKRLLRLGGSPQVSHAVIARR